MSAATALPGVAADRRPSVKNLSLLWWLEGIAAEAGLGLAVDPKLDAGRPLSASDVGAPWRQRLETFSRVGGFGYRLGSAYLEVSRVPARSDKLAKSTLAAQTARSAGPVGESAGARDVETVVRVLTLKRGRADEVASLLSAAAARLGIFAVADDTANAVLVGGSPAAVATAETIVEQLDRPRRSVLLDVCILEVSRSARSQLGVNWTLGV
ncbi:MAG: secretin N-terminal domain-containing protein, partial [Deltaproteobacteria bacterium]